MMAEIEIDCPFTARDMNLDLKLLTENKKIWMVRQVISYMETSSSMAKRYGLKSTNVRKWVYRYNYKNSIYSNSGRPRLLDETSMDKMVQNLSQIDRPTESDINSEIKDEYLSSIQRCRPECWLMNCCGFKRIKMNKKTLSRYKTRLLKKLMRIKTCNVKLRSIILCLCIFCK